ncbi:MAG: cell envelope integrity protein CreD [Bacteroidota bacterium]
MSDTYQSPISRARSWARSSISLRIFTIGFLVLILLIPTAMVQELINERSYARDAAVREVSQSWSNAQEISGPYLNIPYVYYVVDEKGISREHTAVAHFLPKKLSIEAKVSPENRKRGIYEVVVYESQVSVDGEFDWPDFSKFDIDQSHVLWDEAYIEVGISDMRGIQDKVIIDLQGTEYEFEAGLKRKDLAQSGINTDIDWAKLEGAKAPTFEMNLNLNGSQSLYFVPLGKETEVNMYADWKDPSFKGAFIPDSHDISEEHFQANWKIFDLNRNFPQEWIGNSHSPSQSAFGVHLMIPVDEYSKSMRSAKYAILCISLTFLIFFFIEIKNAQRIHPIQYILVGLALVLFYGLLLSLSEHIGFNFAFLISSVAIVGLISGYAKSIIKDKGLVPLLAGLLIILYGVNYVLLQLENYALLVGSLCLFIILALVMALSSKIDWYGLGKKEEEDDFEEIPLVEEE